LIVIEIVESIGTALLPSSSMKKNNYNPEIYSLNKYGIQIKTNQKFTKSN